MGQCPVCTSLQIHGVITGTPHKHAEVIKAWADGALVEYRVYPNHPWREAPSYPSWRPEYEYRVKPKKKSPGLVYLENAYHTGTGRSLAECDVSPKTQVGARAVIEAYKRGELDYD